jgi:hypothetical protein
MGVVLTQSRVNAANAYVNTSVLKTRSPAGGDGAVGTPGMDLRVDPVEASRAIGAIVGGVIAESAFSSRNGWWTFIHAVMRRARALAPGRGSRF